MTTDVYDGETRSRVMRAVKSENTRPEMLVRSLLHRLGFRFRLHRKDLPGRPDIVLPKYRTVIFVHGCFWHQHPGCKKAVIPQANADFWAKKLARNVERDKQASEALNRSGWMVVIVWECELKDLPTLKARLTHMLTR